MGSPTIMNSKPETATMEKKTIKDIIIKPIQALFSNKKKEKTKKEKKTDITEEFEKLHIKEYAKDQKLTPRTEEKAKIIPNEDDKLKIEQIDEDDEFRTNFSIKKIDDAKDTKPERSNRDERIDSVSSSQDSGFAEIEAEKQKEDKVEKEEEIVESLQNLKIDGKDKKLQTIHITRGPTKSSLNFTPCTHPYAKADYSQINQVNKQTFSGGYVTVTRKPVEITEVDIALKNALLNAPHFSLDTPQAQDFLSLVDEVIEEDCPKPIEPEEILADSVSWTELFANFEKETEIADDILSGFLTESCGTEGLQNFNEMSTIAEPPNPIEEFANPNHIDNDELTDFETLITAENRSIFPTPPRDYNMLSPNSDSMQSNIPSVPEYQFSPPLSSPLSKDYERYQDISQIDVSILPTVVTDDGNQRTSNRERHGATSSMTMKQYKDKQKELSMNFSKKECCQLSRSSCKEIFEGYMKKLNKDERRCLCLKVANLELKTAYGVLQQILLSLSDESEQENLQYALFALICDRVLANQAALFVQDFGLNLLKSAALRCPHRSVLTRSLVQCARIALRNNQDLFKGKDAVFREIDAQGDNLVTACARAGDTHADVLAELVRREEDLLPLFLIHHHNAEGYSALQVACRLHSAAKPHLHVVHVLLTHGDADLWRGDVKGGDTPLHLAVNSATCDLNLVLTMFKHVDRKDWKKLAHIHNRSSVTPLEYARCATKTTTRQNYPPEVLEFLRKCR